MIEVSLYYVIGTFIGMPILTTIINKYYYDKNNQYFKDRIPYKAWLHNIISQMYAWQFYLDGDKKNYKGAIKYSEININDVKKKDRL